MPASDPAELLSSLLKHAQSVGATEADAMMYEHTDITLARRMRQPETIERSESSALGLRVFSGHGQAVVSSTDLSREALKELVARAVSMAKSATPDTDASLAPEERLAKEYPDLDLFDEHVPSESWLMAQAEEAEEAALSTPGITNSEGADASYSAYTVTLATAPRSGQGFSGAYRASSISFSVSVLAGKGEHMERDYDYAHARHAADLPDAASIGKNAAARALKRLHPRKVPTAQASVIFDPRVSKSLVGYLANGVSGAAVARGTSFLKGSLNQRVFSPGIRIIDDPHRKRGLASRPFDGEGVANRRMAVVEDGVLTSWLLDMRSANRLGLHTTGHAARSTGSPPSPSSTNLYMEAGSVTPEALMEDIRSGFYVTEVFGMGVNLVTGDYSQGASGYWIENGELAYPVSELTIAGNLMEMFARAVPADDLSFRYSTNAPTLRIDGMTVAGT